MVFTDDMEMKAIAARWPVPHAAVQAIIAGCDAVLVCSGNYDLQAATLEALVKAVEQDEIPYKRVEQALAHQRVAKERFLLGEGLAATPLSAPAGPRAQLRQVVGSESHQAIAAEMAKFA